MKGNLATIHRAIRGLFLSGLLAGPGGAGANEAHQWLERMNQAMRQLSYEGELIYQHDRRVEVLSLVHTVGGGLERERISSLNGRPREVIRDNESVICILPGMKSISVDPRRGSGNFPSLLPLSAQELSDVYNISLGGDGRVAGRQARILDIRPRDRLRYGHRLYLDQEQGLPLKLDMLNAEGETIAQIMFSRLKIDPGIPFESSGPSLKTEGYAVIRHGKRSPGRAAKPFNWSFSALPKGFRVNGQDMRKEEANGDWQEHVVVTDGLANVSVYVERSRAEGGLEGPSRMGAVSAFGRRSGNGQITAVGEAPVETVRLIAEAVKFSP
ncbi:MAG: MucB/RseB C-terminal domain-containing protein [Gammaproteobacteria bacterium]|nr:MucB/RseB C-terminal domain-containing protein [Gammaproteobacteria bacterium]